MSGSIDMSLHNLRVIQRRGGGGAGGGREGVIGLFVKCGQGSGVGVCSGEGEPELG